MNVSGDIFRAVHERKWLSVEYRNARKETTRYRMGAPSIDPRRRKLEVRGMHLLNAVPYTKQFKLIERIDEDSFEFGAVKLDDG